MAEVFEYELRGKDTSFGNTVKNAVKAVGELKSAGAQVLASFTGGLLGGGIAQSVLSTVNLIRDVIREARQLQVNAERFSISKNEARGFANLETALDLPKNTFGNIAGAVENAVQEALQGNAEMAKQFGAVGLDARELEGLSKVDQMFRVLAAFRSAGAGPEQRYALRQLFGGGAEAVEPYAVGGSRQIDWQTVVAEMARLSQNDIVRFIQGNASYDLYTHRAYGLFKDLRDVEGRSSMRGELAGYSEFGLNRGQRLSRIDESLAAEVRQLERQKLPLEEQLNRIIQERAVLMERILKASNPDNQRQLIGQEINLAMQEEQIRQRMAGAASGSGMAVTGISRNMDQLARAGFFRGGAPDIATETMRKQLMQLERISALLKSLPPEIARTL